MKIATHIHISAKPQEVWKVLMDTKQYPQWNPFVQSLSGEVAEGKRIKVKLPGMTFTPTVLALKPNREFRWRGKLLIKGLFDGEHSFQLQAADNDCTLFLHSETFSGLLVPLFKKKLLTTTNDGFEAMNRALKNRVESKAAQ
ncbi:SRPBCC domain-containing protein [Echinicola soli]|uniref:SRPBCC domain-containing protein n=1 Tax=Echinicola soli TaxID=2591634 RepID=A0A514CET6_9BACT|nr:SRPBCC domain-containing protein [Echinicola soli]QDH78341.1 SRPBCC domain-containing protein [Echinicola soli]